MTKEPSADSVVGCPVGASPDFGDETVTSHHFGEEGAKLTYGSYLRLEQLLSAQVLESDPPAHDELLFITIHQVYELWFKQLLHEVDAATAAMFGGRLWWAKHLLKRVATIEDVLIRQIAVLETMTPQDFLVFRELLSPASGFQSAQFRELEFASGAKDPTYLNRFRGLTEAEQKRLAERLEAPSLWDGFVHAVSQAGLPAASEDELRDSLVKVARDRDSYGELWELSEALLDHDEAAALWRARHVTMVERQIGTKSGTGGSTGAPYLRSRLGLHYFPLLWELRSFL
ncbi:tryptophan 2,3-dioxygenase [Catenulispora sp. GP43]|uniref:tryptophan 2,3-dioxygenase n=1 Tax=Catenulispora sp. GP43 TaxID=3156263 RepID=UPI0035135C75